MYKLFSGLSKVDLTGIVSTQQYGGGDLVVYCCTGDGVIRSRNMQSLVENSAFFSTAPTNPKWFSEYQSYYPIF